MKACFMTAMPLVVSQAVKIKIRFGVLLLSVPLHYLRINPDMLWYSGYVLSHDSDFLCIHKLMNFACIYYQGVGYPLDIVVCSALGADMYDCVYPTRTARFGTALVPEVIASFINGKL